MKEILIGVLLAVVSGVVIADCKTYVSHGQYKQNCDLANTPDNQVTEYSEVSRAGLIRSDKATRALQRHNPNKQTYMAQLQTTPLPQPGQIRQLIEYANSQGCKWEGTQHRPLLICPK
jgi:hypothetical protein